ncbi:response regulator transcription factor [Sciscionella marina]|uniref:response regulator transcription factor n=1 Tax=Sciscionella marina TaxID=508770 RepID=UPI00037A03B2|nr:helix-turn-helix transcriptional regulator [Sciscionella marina]
MIRRRTGLSAVELDVLEAIARGMTNTQIAMHQYRSVETVRSHIKNIHRKLSARNRANAVAIAYHLGLFATHHDRTRSVRAPLALPARRTRSVGGRGGAEGPPAR